MPDQDIELDIERETSNPDLYRIAPDEKKDKREYRTGKINDDIKKRINELCKYTGVLKFNTDVAGLQKRAILKLLERKGLMVPGEFQDIYFLCVDEEIRGMERDKDEIKKARQNKIASERIKKLIIPGGPGTNVSPIRG